MEFLKSTVQAGLNVFSYFTARRHAEFSLNFNEPQPIYASKRYVYHKSVIIFTFPYYSSLFLVTRHFSLSLVTNLRHSTREVNLLFSNILKGSSFKNCYLQSD